MQVAAGLTKSTFRLDLEPTAGQFVLTPYATRIASVIKTGEDEVNLYPEIVLSSFMTLDTRSKKALEP